MPMIPEAVATYAEAVATAMTEALATHQTQVQARSLQLDLQGAMVY